jgi:hypothetical protein
MRVRINGVERAREEQAADLLRRTVMFWMRSWGELRDHRSRGRAHPGPRPTGLRISTPSPDQVRHGQGALHGGPPS